MLGGGGALNDGGRILVAARWMNDWKNRRLGNHWRKVVSGSLEDLGWVPGGEHGGEKQGDK